MERSYRKREAVWIAPVFSVALGACLCTSAAPQRTMPRASRFSRAKSARSWSNAVTSVIPARRRRFGAAFGSTRVTQCGPAAIAGRRSFPATLTKACFFKRSRQLGASSRCLPKEGCREASSPISASGSRWVRLTRATARRPPCQLRPPLGRSDWWSLKELKRPAVPHVAGALPGWPANPIDAFVLAKLAKTARAFAAGQPPRPDPPPFVRSAGLAARARRGRGVRDRPVRRCLRAAGRSTARQPSLRRAPGSASGWTWSTSPRLTGTTRIASGRLPGPTAIT